MSETEPSGDTHIVNWYPDNLMDMDDCACEACEACDRYNGILIFRCDLVDNDGYMCEACDRYNGILIFRYDLVDNDGCACEACDRYNGILIFSYDLVHNDDCATSQQSKMRFRQIEYV